MGRDSTDRLIEDWARIRREIVGISHPLRTGDYLGAPRCTLAARRDLHAGATSPGRIDQQWPEFPYQGDSFLVNQCFKGMPPVLKEIMDWHYTLPVPRNKRLRADMMGIGPNDYWDRVKQAKERVDRFLASSKAGLTDVA
jgi:hypothetical protein